MGIFKSYIDARVLFGALQTLHENFRDFCINSFLKNI